MSDNPAIAETRQERKQRVEGERHAAKAAREAERLAKVEAKLARYKQLRANVRRRRVSYGFFIVLAILVFLGSVADILFNSSNAKLIVFVSYAVLFVLGLILLLSRRKHLEEVEELAALQRVLLEDPVSGEVFQLAADKLPELVGMEFTSPVSGQYYRMPALDSAPVERIAPRGSLLSKPFTHGAIHGEVATYGHEPQDPQFR